MAADNATILAKVWLNGTNDFQQRIPDPTQHGVDATMQALFDPMNRQYYNQFIDSLVMRIGYTYVHPARHLQEEEAHVRKQRAGNGSKVDSRPLLRG